MNGNDYIAVRRLSDKQGRTLADVGETCERVPAESLGWLAERGWIKPGERPVERRPRRTRFGGNEEGVAQESEG